MQYANETVIMVSRKLLYTDAWWSTILMPRYHACYNYRYLELWEHLALKADTNNNNLLRPMFIKYKGKPTNIPLPKRYLHSIGQPAI